MSTNINSFEDSGSMSSTQNDLAYRSGPANLISEFRNLVADIEDFVSSTTTLTGEQLEQARARVQSRVKAAKQTMQQVGESGWQRARHSAELTNEYVHEQPWTAVGVGIAAGFLTGFLVSRRH